MNAECTPLSCASLFLCLQKWQIRCRARTQPRPLLASLTLGFSLLHRVLFLFTKLQTLVPRAYVRSSGSRAHKSSLLQLTGMWPFPSSTQASRPGGTGRAVGALWDRHKLCEHSCRAILVCLLAASLCSVFTRQFVCSDGENRRTGREEGRRAGCKRRDPQG